MVAMMAFLLIGGAIADRLPRHQVLVAADLVMASAQAVAAILVLTGEARPWQLAVLAVVLGAGLGFFLPAATGLLPQTVGETQLSQANAVNRVGPGTAQISGAAAGGIVVALAGPGWGLAADSASFVLAAALRVGMRFPALPPAEPSRLSAYDYLGSQALAPAGAAVAGPLAVVFGTAPLLTAGGLIILGLTVPVLLVPEVRQLRRRAPVSR
jgi:MFS family permease